MPAAAGKRGAAGRSARLILERAHIGSGFSPAPPMNDLLYRRLRIRADAGWRHVVRAAAFQFYRQARNDLALRAARKRFYRSMLAEYRADQRDLANAFRF